MKKEQETIFSGQNRKAKGVARGKRIPKEPVIVPIEEHTSIKSNEDYLDALGREKPDDTPMAPPIGYKKQPSMVENIRAMVQRELSLAAANAGHETFEEADDFDVGDDYDPSSPYEEVFEPPAPAEPAPGSSPPSPPAGGKGDGGKGGETGPTNTPPDPNKPTSQPTS